MYKIDIEIYGYSSGIEKVCKFIIEALLNKDNLNMIFILFQSIIQQKHSLT